jgi:hypothetical protein
MKAWLELVDWVVGLPSVVLVLWFALWVVLSGHKIAFVSR